MVDHGQNIARPWLTMVWPCSSSRGMLIWMLQHIKYLTTCHWSNGHLIFEYGTDHGWPWSDHGCLILHDHGQPWLTMVRPCSSPRCQCWFQYLHLIYQVFDHDWPDNGHLIFECGTDHGWPWLTMVRSWLPDHGKPWLNHGQTLPDHVHPSEVCWFECLHIKYLTMIQTMSFDFWMWNWPWLPDHGQPWLPDHGQPWLPDHGQPWLNHGQNIARPCSPFRGMLIWMSAHQVLDHDPNHVIWFLNVELTMVDHGQTMVAWPWSTMVEPWSKHCQTMVDHGLAMFTLQRYVDLNVCTSSIWPWCKPCHLIFACGTDHGWPWSNHGCLTMVNHGRQWWPFNMTMVNYGSTMVKTLPDHGQPIGYWPWSNHGSTMVDHGLTMFIPQGINLFWVSQLRSIVTQDTVLQLAEVQHQISCYLQFWIW